MIIRGILFVCLILSSAWARAATVHLEWERSITAFQATAVLPDHLGRFAVVGAASNRAGIFLLNTDGEVVASVATCFPTNKPFLAPAAVSDRAGRIFLLWPVWCTAFEPGLAALSRLGGWNAPDDQVMSAVPDEAGGVYAGLRYSLAGLSYIDHFRCGVQRQYFPSQLKGDLAQSIVARSPLGTVYLVGAQGWYRCAPIRVISYNSNGEVLWDKVLGPPPSEIPSEAACDSQGNLLIAGTYRTNCVAGENGFMPVLVKLSPHGELVWRAIVPVTGGHSTVNVNAADEIFVSGGHGTFKYSSEGRQLWHVPEPTTRVRLTPQGDVIAQRGGTVRKLTASGDESWRLDSPQSPVDFAVDDAAVYIATTKEISGPSAPPLSTETILRKYVERFTTPEVKTAVEVPELATCEPAVIGPCDVPSVLPPPAFPPAEVTVTRVRRGRMAVCWPTNYTGYRLEAARHINRRKPERTKWVPVAANITTNADNYCVTARIARYGRNYRIVP